MDYRLMFPKEYLAAHDLKGQDVLLTISRVAAEDLQTQDGKEKKPVVYFDETRKAAEKNRTKEKKLVLNITNARTIAKLHGNEMDEWKGKKVVLYPTTCQAFGEETDCIRIRGEVPE